MLRVGQGTWVDAVPARFERGAVVFRVPAQVLETSAFPAVLDPVLGPETGMDSPVTSPGTELFPAVAHDGTNFLVVWSDLRRQNGSRDVFGARVNGAGLVLDVGGLVISAAPGNQDLPAVAWTGTAFLVVWEDHRGTDADVFAARVTSAGAVLDPSGIAVSSGSVEEGTPTVAGGGAGNALVAWRDLRSGEFDLYGARVDAAGAVLDPAGQPICTVAGDQTSPSVDFDGTNYFAVWRDARAASPDVYGARVSLAGAVLDPTGHLVTGAPGSQEVPSVAWNGTNHLVAWLDFRGGAPEIYAARVSPAGAVADLNGILVASGPGGRDFPAVASDGAGYLVVWQDTRAGSTDVYGARVNGAGQVLDPAGITVSAAPSSQYLPAVAFGGTQYLVAWSDLRRGIGDDIFGARVSPAGNVLDPAGFVVSTSANVQNFPAVASDGTNWLVVWEDSRGAGIDIYGVRVTGLGTVLDPAGIAISTATSLQLVPAVAWNGSSWLVVWQDFRGNTAADIYAARVDAAGQLLDANGLAVSSAAEYQTAPRVASDGTTALVVWEDTRLGGPNVYGARVDGSGQVLDPAGLLLSAAAGIQQAPAVAFGTTDYFVVWREAGTGTGTGDVHGTRVTPAGAVLDPGGLVVSGAAADERSPAVAFGGGSWLTVWTELRGGSTPDIRGARVSPAGAVLDPTGFDVAAGLGSAAFPQVAWTGRNALVVYDELGSTGRDVFAVRVSPAGALRDMGGVRLSGVPGEQQFPAVACNGGRFCFVAWDSFVAQPTVGAFRVLGRMFIDDERPSTEAMAVTTLEDTPVTVVLTASDPDGDPLTFQVEQVPVNGSLTGAPPNLVYSPKQDFFGTDTFTFTVDDGTIGTPAAPVTITVRPVNDPPVAAPQAVSTTAGVAVDITLTGTDVDGDALRFEVATDPSRGALSGDPPVLTYTPTGGTVGTDSFSFVAKDGVATSAPATVVVTVRPPAADAGSPDAGMPRGAVVVQLGGCGCGASGPPFAGALWLLAAFALRRTTAHLARRGGPQEIGARASQVAAERAESPGVMHALSPDVSRRGER